MTELPPGASPVDAIAPGTRLREWDVVRLRGRGSYGVVFEARRSSWQDEPPRALKVFDPIVSSAARQSLLAEYTALTSVRHPHLLAGIDAFDIAEPPFAGCVVFVLELADEDLGNRIAHAPAGRLDAAAVGHVGAEVATGLAALHDMGRIHGDVKPENILRVGDRWVLGDFGVTALLSGSYAFTPGTTIDYRPPELAAAPEGSRLHRSADVWALGVTLHVAATGRHPFRGPDPMMRYASVLRGDRTEVPADLDPGLGELIDQGCLTPDPRRRLTAVELARRLAAAVTAQRRAQAQPAPAQPARLAGSGVTTGGGPGSVTHAGGPSAAKQPARWVTLLLAAVVSAVVAQVVALGAGAVDADLDVRRGLYVVVSLAALGAIAAKWSLPGRNRLGVLSVGGVTWAVATLLLFGALG